MPEVAAPVDHGCLRARSSQQGREGETSECPGMLPVSHQVKSSHKAARAVSLEPVELVDKLSTGDTRVRKASPDGAEAKL